MKCPKCAYERQPTDVAPAWQCPACQVAYAKAVAQKPAVAVVPAPPRSPTAPPTRPDDIDEAAGLAASVQKIVIYSIVRTSYRRVTLGASSIYWRRFPQIRKS